MPAWSEKRVHIGSHAKRIDAPAKVTGAAKYSSDVQPEGWLYGMIYRSRRPAARVTGVNIAKAKQIPGITAAVVERDGKRNVRFSGDEMAAVPGSYRQARLHAFL